MKQLKGIAIAVVLVAVAAVAAVYLGMKGISAAEAAAPEIGAKMPDFKLKDYSGKEHSLEAYKGKIVVLDFCSQECPVSRGADPHFAELVREYQAKGVVFLGVDSHRETTPEQIKKYAEENKIPQPILKDEGNKYADAVGAKVTPEIYILDKEGKLAYHGPLDDRAEPTERGTKNYTKDAIDALLSGKAVAVPKAKAWGCSIKRV